MFYTLREKIAYSKFGKIVATVLRNKKYKIVVCIGFNKPLPILICQDYQNNQRPFGVFFLLQIVTTKFKFYIVVR